MYFHAFPGVPPHSSAPGAWAGGHRDLPPHAYAVVPHWACRGTEGGKDEKSRDPRPKRGGQSCKERSLYCPYSPVRVLQPLCALLDKGRVPRLQRAGGLDTGDPDAGFWVGFPATDTEDNSVRKREESGQCAGPRVGREHRIQDFSEMQALLSTAWCVSME